MKHGRRLRRKGVIERLTAQLQSGKKPDKEIIGKFVNLTDSDKKRIEREIGILKESIEKS